MRAKTYEYFIEFFGSVSVSVVRVAIDCDRLTVVVAFQLPKTRTLDSCLRCLSAHRTLFTSLPFIIYSSSRAFRISGRGVEPQKNCAQRACGIQPGAA
jgi:hypothetical protein